MLFIWMLILIDFVWIKVLQKNKVFVRISCVINTFSCWINLFSCVINFTHLKIILGRLELLIVSCCVLISTTLFVPGQTWVVQLIELSDLFQIEIDHSRLARFKVVVHEWSRWLHKGLAHYFFSIHCSPLKLWLNVPGFNKVKNKKKLISIIFLLITDTKLFKKTFIQIPEYPVFMIGY